MPNILLTRIDNRLLHGQVATQWTKHIGANLILVANDDVLTLVESGVPIKDVNIGNMHMAEGKRQVAGVVAVDDKDVEAFKKLRDLGVNLEIRKVPTESAEDINKLFS